MPKSKGISTTVDWQDEDASPPGDIPITKPGCHYLQDHINRTKQEQVEYKAKVLRDMGGRKRDARRIPPPEYQFSGRTFKSSSRIRFPSEQFRKNYAAIRWDQ